MQGASGVSMVSMVSTRVPWRSRSRPSVGASVLVAVATVAGAGAGAQQHGVGSVAAVRNSASGDSLEEWDATIERMAHAGNLVVASASPDRTLPGRVHEYLVQAVDGIRVYGSGISRQLDADDSTVSLFGNLHARTDADTVPTLAASEAAARLEQAHGGRLAASRRPPVLVLLPQPDGGVALAYRIGMSDARWYFVDAHSGRILHVQDAFNRQAAIGSGLTFGGKWRELSTTRVGRRFHAFDRMRPAGVVTLDARFNLDRLDRLILAHWMDELPVGTPVWNDTDIATDADNYWEDVAVVEAHAYTGWTHDYLRARHGWHGIDGANGRIVSIVNYLDSNAFAVPPPLGPEGQGAYVYGRLTGPTSEEPFTTLDTVAHELMHGVTHFAVSRRTGNELGLERHPTMRPGPESFEDSFGQTHRCDAFFWTCVDGRFVLASDETTAVNEAFSDIIAVSTGFFSQSWKRVPRWRGAGVPVGRQERYRRADYLMGGRQRFGPVRSLAEPGSLDVQRGHGYPDHYSKRYEFLLLGGEGGIDYSQWIFVAGELAFLSEGGYGYGGEHWNSTILSHAFYLAVEGGTNRTSGLSVEGVGADGRADVERIFFRAMTDLMPSTTSLPLTADVLRQAAADLDSGGEAEHAVRQALVAVGLAPPEG